MSEYFSNTERKILIQQIRGGFLVSTPNAHRWNDHGNDAVICGTLDLLIEHINTVCNPPEEEVATCQ